MTRALAGHGPQQAADLLATIPTGTVPDRYGDGGVVADLEAEVGEPLGQSAAVQLPSGIMAQQAALRVHADRRSRRTVVVHHPQSHLDVHEGRALQRAQEVAAAVRDLPGVTVVDLGAGHPDGRPRSGAGRTARRRRHHGAVGRGDPGCRRHPGRPRPVGGPPRGVAQVPGRRPKIGAAHERQRQAPGLLPGNLNSV